MMYQDNTVVTDQVTIIKNMPNDEGKLYIQVYNSKGNYIAIDKDEFLRQVTSLEGTIEFMHKRTKEDQDIQQKIGKESNQRWQKITNDFDQYKSIGRALVIETLEALSTFKEMIRAHRKRTTPKQKEQIRKVEKLFAELNNVTGPYHRFFENNWSAGPNR